MVLGKPRSWVWHGGSWELRWDSLFPQQRGRGLRDRPGGRRDRPDLALQGTDFQGLGGSCCLPPAPSCLRWKDDLKPSAKPLDPPHSWGVWVPRSLPGTGRRGPADVQGSELGPHPPLGTSPEIRTLPCCLWRQPGPCTSPQEPRAQCSLPPHGRGPWPPVPFSKLPWGQSHCGGKGFPGGWGLQGSRGWDVPQEWGWPARGQDRREILGRLPCQVSPTFHPEGAGS